MRNSNIAFFIPQIGCKHRCIFCNQSAISGEDGLPSIEEIKNSCKKASQNLKKDVENSEIAFFGGSFTALSEKIRVKYLEVAKEMIKKYGFKGIRCSTRPDAVNTDIINEYLYYGGTSIELGCQSMDNTVLIKNKRGHTADDVKKASLLIKKSGLELGHQIMIGLFSDNKGAIYKSAKKLAALKPNTIRIYPTVVMKNTELETLYKNNQYTPLSLEEAVEISADLLFFFENNKIKVIRLGLHHEKSLEENMVAGPYHPAFRELCESKLFLERILTTLENKNKDEVFTIFCNIKDGSKIRGQKQNNLKKLTSLGYNVRVKEVEGIDVGSFFIET